MQIELFCDRLEEHPGLTCRGLLEGEQPADDYLVVKDRQTGATFKVMVETILAEEWDVLEGIFTGRREANVLEHMTRIVGYFSKVKNWNKSKLGELRDRQAGNYRVDTAKPVVAEVPRDVPSHAPREAAQPARENLVATA